MTSFHPFPKPISFFISIDQQWKYILRGKLNCFKPLDVVELNSENRFKFQNNYLTSIKSVKTLIFRAKK